MNESSDDPPPIARTRIWDLTKSYVSSLSLKGRPGRTRRDLEQTALPLRSPSSLRTHSHGLGLQNPSTSPEPNLQQQNQQYGANDVPTAAPGANTAPPASHPGNTLPAPADSSLEQKDQPRTFTKLYRTGKMVILSSWINWLLLCVPPGIALGAVNRSMGASSPVSPTVVFAINAVAIIPLASLLGYATESVAANLGDTVGALLNVTFGNAVELIIFMYAIPFRLCGQCIALVADEIIIVQASLLGSILANLLLILGMCFLFGGLRFREQLYNSAITQMSACLLSLSVISLLLPTAFHASFSNLDTANLAVVKVSRGTSIVLLLVYVLYLLFQLKSHAYIYESTPQHMIDEESHPGVLAEMLNSSSSSESSSDDDSDASSGSNTTVKRIRNALRKKRRRKSSVVSKDVVSTPTVPSPGSQVVDDTSTIDHVNFASSGRRPSTNEYIMCGEAVTHEKVVSHPLGEKTKDKSSDRKRPGKAPNSCTVPQVKDEVVAAADGVTGSNPPVRGLKIENMGAAESQTNDVQRRAFNVRNLSYKPAFQGVLSSNIFPPTVLPAAPVQETARVLSAGPPRLRRTNSLPGRLYATPPPTTAIPSAQPLPHLVSKTLAKAKEAGKDKEQLSRTSAIILLLVTTGLVAVCAEFLVDSIDYLVRTSGISQVFIGLIILPIVGNAAEHVTAVTVASKNKMDLAIGVALGSSIQIALFVTPVIVLLGWFLDTEMSLYFSLFETVSLFASAFIVNYLMLDGRTNYLEGALLIAAYVIIAVASFFYPSCENTNTANGGPSDVSCP